MRQLSCCDPPGNKIPSKEAMRYKKWERFKWKYEMVQDDPCVCKEISFDAKYYHPTNETSTDVDTFTTANPDNSDDSLIEEDVTNTNNEVADGVTDMIINVSTDVENNADISAFIDVIPNGSPEVVVNKVHDEFSNQVTDVDIDETNYQVTEIVTDEVDKVLNSDDTILSDTSTTKKKVSYDEPTIKYRHVGDFQTPYDIMEQSETTSDNNNSSDYEYIPDDNDLQQLVSFVYLKDHKKEEAVKPSKLLTIDEPKIRATKNILGLTKTTASPKTQSTKKIPTKVLDRAVIDTPNSVLYPKKGQKPKAKSFTTKSSRPISKLGRPPATYKPVNKPKYELKYYRTTNVAPLQYLGLKQNREISEDISSDNSYFETKLNMPFNYLGHKTKFMGRRIIHTP